MVSLINPSMMNLQTLLDSFKELTPNDRSLIERAYHKAEAAHADQIRKSGEPYFTHCLAVASILAEMNLDSETIAAALMHDIVEDTKVSLEDLYSEFGETIAKMVDGVTKLKKVPLNTDKDTTRRTSSINRENESLRKMLLTLNDDVRPVLIKLADRLHNMRTLGYMSQDKQREIAKETMDIFAPLANRLGIWQVKWELEDLSFRYLEPDAYKAIAASLDERRADRESYLQKIADALRNELAKFGVHNAHISGRPKHIYSIYKKMQRKNLEFDQIYDVRAVRVIVDEIPQCYLVLGVVHSLWRPIPREFDDYIASPKDNFYRSLHTAVLDDQAKTVEVQIRTWEMHEDSEYGIAAHWRYKEGSKAHTKAHKKAFEERLNDLRRRMEFGSEERDNPDTFVETMKTDVFQDRVYVFTPKGDIHDLPLGATPIDFAYHIHTEIGNRCRGARIGGKLVSLNTPLKSGDKVEILTAKRGGPSLDWLNPDLGFVHTSRAREKIRHWLRKQNREKHVAFGREVLERELKRLGVLDVISFDMVAHLFEYAKLEDFLAAVGFGDINGAQIANRVLENERRTQQDLEQDLLKPTKKPPLTVDTGNGVTILGTGGLLVNLARCCSPMPGDEIVGYITRGRGATVHRRDCNNIQAIHDPERLIDVSWGGLAREQRYSVPVEIVAYDREGLMRDISTVIADEQVNLSKVTVSTRQNIATFYLTMEIENNRQLTRVLSKIESVNSVVEAHRRSMS